MAKLFNPGLFNPVMFNTKAAAAKTKLFSPAMFNREMFNTGEPHAPKGMIISGFQSAYQRVWTTMHIEEQ